MIDAGKWQTVDLRKYKRKEAEEWARLESGEQIALSASGAVAPYGGDPFVQTRPAYVHGYDVPPEQGGGRSLRDSVSQMHMPLGAPMERPSSRPFNPADPVTFVESAGVNIRPDPYGELVAASGMTRQQSYEAGGPFYGADIRQITRAFGQVGAEAQGMLREELEERQQLYARAAARLGMSAHQVDMELERQGIGWGSPAARGERGGAILQYAAARAGQDEPLRAVHGEVSPVTAFSATVARQQQIARWQRSTGELTGTQIPTGQHVVDVTSLLAIPGVVRSPTGGIATGATESKMAKAMKLGLMEHQISFTGPGIGAPQYSNVLAGGASVPEVVQRARSFVSFSRTTPEGASYRDPEAFGAGARTVIRKLGIPEGVEPALQIGQQFGRGADIVPYKGAAPLDIGVHHLSATLAAQDIITDPDTLERQLVMQYETNLGVGVGAGGKGGGIKTGSQPEYGTAARWGGVAQFTGDVRDIYALGASVASVTSGAERAKYFPRIDPGFTQFGWEQAQAFKQYLLTPGVIGMREAETSQLMRLDDPTVQLKKELGLLREDVGYSGRTPKGAGRFFETAIGVELPLGAQFSQPWLTHKQQLSGEELEVIARKHPQLAEYYERTGMRANSPVSDIGRAYLAGKGLDRGSPYSTVSISDIYGRMGEIAPAIRERMEATGLPQNSRQYRAEMRRETMRAIGETFPGRGISFQTAGMDKPVILPNPAQLLAYTGGAETGAPMGGAPTKMGMLLQSALSAEGGRYRTVSQLSGRAEPPPSSPEELVKRVQAEQARMAQELTVGGIDPTTQKPMQSLPSLTSSPTFRKAVWGANAGGARFGAQVAPIEGLPANRWVGGPDVLRQMVQAHGFDPGQREELIKNMLMGREVNPRILASRYPQVSEEQMDITLEYMPVSEWVEQGYGTAKQYLEQYRSQIGISKAVGEAGGGDFDRDMYMALMASVYRRGRGGTEAHHLVNLASPEDIWKAAAEHPAGELESELKKIRQGSTIGGVLERIRDMGTDMPAEQMAAKIREREEVRSGTGSIYNAMIRQMAQRTQGMDPVSRRSRAEFGGLALTAIDVTGQSAGMRTMMDLYRSANLGTGGYRMGEGGPGSWQGGAPGLASLVAESVARTTEVSPESAAAGIIRPEVAGDAFSNIVKEIESIREGDSTRGLVSAITPFMLGEQGRFSFEELSRNMPIPGMIGELAAARGMRKFVDPETGEATFNKSMSGLDRTWIPGMQAKAAAERGRQSAEVIRHLSGKAEMPLEEALMASTEYEKIPYRQRVAQQVGKLLGFGRGGPAQQAPAPASAEDITAQAAGGGGAQKPPPPPVAEADMYMDPEEAPRYGGLGWAGYTQINIARMIHGEQPFAPGAGTSLGTGLTTTHWQAGVSAEERGWPRTTTSRVEARAMGAGTTPPPPPPPPPPFAGAAPPPDPKRPPPGFDASFRRSTPMTKKQQTQEQVQRALMQNLAELFAGSGGEQRGGFLSWNPDEGGGMRISGRVGDKRIRATEEHVERLTTLNDALKSWQETVQPLVESGEQLSKQQVKLTETLLKTERGIGIEGIIRAGPGGTVGGPAERAIGLIGGMAPGLVGLRQAETHIERQRIAQQISAAGGGPPGGVLTGLGGEGGGGGGGGMLGGLMGRLGGAARKLTSGWELMRLRRMWALTGGVAMGAIPGAAQEEQLALTAATAQAPMGAVQPGGMMRGLLTTQAQQQQFQLQMGRAAQQSWGWMPRALADTGLGTAAGVGLPAAGLGLAAGWGAGILGIGAAGPIGLGVAGIAGAVGTYNTIRADAGDRYGQAIRFARDMQSGGSIGVNEIFGSGASAQQLANQITGGGTNTAQQRQLQLGQQILSGELGGLGVGARTRAIQEAYQYAPEWMSQPGAEQMGAEWMRLTPGATNIKDIYQDPLFAMMGARGTGPQQIAEQTQGLGMRSSQWQDVARMMSMVSEQEWGAGVGVAGQWQGLRAWGESPMDITKASMPLPDTSGLRGKLGEVAEQGGFLGALAGIGQKLVPDFGVGYDLERMPEDPMYQAMLGQIAGMAQQQRMMGMAPIEMPTTAEDVMRIYQGGQMQMGQAAMGLGQRFMGMGATPLTAGAAATAAQNVVGLQGLQATQNFLGGDQWTMSMLGQANMQGPFSQVNVGGGLQVDTRPMREAITAALKEVIPPEYFDSVMEGMDAIKPLTEPETGLQMGTTRMYAGFAEGYQLPSTVDAERFAEYGKVTEEQGRRGLARTQTELTQGYEDFQARQAQERLDLQEVSQFGGTFTSPYGGGTLETRGTFEIQKELRNLSRIWEDFTSDYNEQNRALQQRQFMENWQVRAERLPQRFEWQRADLAFQGQQQSIQFGWQMEDIQENLRFATGRDRRRLLRQQERAAITFGMGQGRLEEMGERVDTSERWAKEDLDRERRHFEERMGLQDSYQQRYRQYIDERRKLEDELQMVHEFSARFSIDAAQENLTRQQELQEELRAIQEQYKALNEELENSAAQQASILKVIQMLVAQVDRDGPLETAWDGLISHMITSLAAVRTAATLTVNGPR